MEQLPIWIQIAILASGWIFTIITKTGLATMFKKGQEARNKDEIETISKNILSSEINNIIPKDLDERLNNIKESIVKLEHFVDIMKKDIDYNKEHADTIKNAHSNIEELKTDIRILGVKMEQIKVDVKKHESSITKISDNMILRPSVFNKGVTTDE